MKAFLSHSTIDKDFVRAVAQELGRQFCIFDEQSFSTGDHFKDSIQHGLGESSIFVLFASRSSLKSIWVGFEADEAWFQLLRNKLSKSLVYLIDSSLRVSDIPEWLRRALVRRENSPKVIARDIRHHLDELLRERQYSLFIGRSKSVEDLERSLTSIDTSSPLHTVFITGLPGIGRRSLIRRTAPTILNLRRQIDIRLGEGDSINDICVNIADHIEPYSTKEGFERIVRQIRGLSDEEALKRTIANLRALVAAGDLPIFLNEGGVLDDDGYIREPVQSILRTLAPNDDIYIFFVSHRRPQSTLEFSMPVIHLSPLKEDETKRLISMLANQFNLRISPTEVAILAKSVAGYPPAAYFAIQQSKYYGLDLVLRESARLVQFRTSVFLRHLSALSFNDNERNVLTILASFSPLPLFVLLKALSSNLTSLHDSIVRLIDLSLIITTKDGYYRIADPIADAAIEVFGFPTDEQNEALAQSLSEFMQGSQIETSRLELSRVLFRVSLVANNKVVAESAIHFANDLIRLTETFYHERKYDQAEEFGYAALDERPESVSARSYLIRALIQNEKWTVAETQIQELQRYGPIQDVYFLSGFLERKKGRATAAIDSYKKAERFGKRGAAINRELALCYFLVGDHKQASRYIKEALKRHGDNPYVVDLWIKIAVSQGDEASARKALGQLEMIDNRRYYQHRRSIVELSFGHLSEALTAARLAVQGSTPPPFQALAHLVYCEIESDNLDKAEDLLLQLEQQFRNLRQDIQIVLRCRLELARKRFSEALLHSERISDKNTIFYKRIRHDALVGEVRYSALKDDVRANYEKEIALFNNELAVHTASLFISDELEPFK
jgi:tetratricopeptide (TPR) repeat protein